MDADQLKHLEFVQNIIARMNKNSFQIKGWIITIISALLALYASSKKSEFMFVAIAPTLVFMFIDAYYLQQERKFIGLYNDIINNKIYKCEMPINRYIGGKYNYWKVLRSKTILPIYLLLIVGLFIAGLLLK